jgi:hypothetical protein
MYRDLNTSLKFWISLILILWSVWAWVVLTDPNFPLTQTASATSTPLLLDSIRSKFAVLKDEYDKEVKMRRAAPKPTDGCFFLDQHYGFRKLMEDYVRQKSPDDALYQSLVEILEDTGEAAVSRIYSKMEKGNSVGCQQPLLLDSEVIEEVVAIARALRRPPYHDPKVIAEARLKALR